MNLALNITTSIRDKNTQITDTNVFDLNMNACRLHDGFCFRRAHAHVACRDTFREEVNGTVGGDAWMTVTPD